VGAAVDAALCFAAPAVELVLWRPVVMGHGWRSDGAMCFVIAALVGQPIGAKGSTKFNSAKPTLPSTPSRLKRHHTCFSHESHHPPASSLLTFSMTAEHWTN